MLKGYCVSDIIAGKYQVLRCEEHMEWGIAYLALDKLCQQPITIVSLKPHEKYYQATVNLFEMQKCFSLPGILPIIEVIQEGDDLIVVREHLNDCKYLSHMLKEGPIPEQKVIAYGKQLCNALNHLQRFAPSIVYRFLHPNDILVSSDSTYISLDPSKIFEWGNRDDSCISASNYYAPEVYELAKKDFRSDIYSLGVILHQMVTGHDYDWHRPFYEFQPIRYYDSNLSEGLEHIIAKCMKLNPDERYQNYEELLYDLERYHELPGHQLSLLFKRWLRKARNRKHN